MQIKNNTSNFKLGVARIRLFTGKTREEQCSTIKELIDYEYYEYENLKNIVNQ